MRISTKLFKSLALVPAESPNRPPARPRRLDGHRAL